jgi:hypothetical protein
MDTRLDGRLPWLRRLLQPGYIQIRVTDLGAAREDL